MTNNPKPLYYVTHSFFWKELKLAGRTRDIFAVILGFYRRKGGSLPIPYHVFKELTGTSKSVFVTSVRRLEQLGLIKAVHAPGRRTVYSVSDEVMELYNRQSGNWSENETGPKTEPVSGQDRNRSEISTGTSPKTGPYKRNKNKRIINITSTDVNVSGYTPSATFKTISRPDRKPD